MSSRNGTCIVVGASSGIGLAVARRLGGAGRKVALLARRQSELDAQVALLNESRGAEVAKAYVHDAANVDDVDALDDDRRAAPAHARVVAGAGRDLLAGGRAPAAWRGRAG